MIKYVNFLGYDISPYAFFFFLSFIIASIVLKFNLKKFNSHPLFFILITLLTVFIGIYGSAFLSSIEYYKFDEVMKSGVFHKGKSFFGGLLLCLISFYIFFLIYRKISFIEFITAIFPALLIGYSVGRLGCFFSGDGCYGIPTDLPIGMSFPNGTQPIFVKVHPTPLYESILNFFLFLFIQYKFIKSTNILDYKKIIMYSLFGFGLFRFLIEFIRTNPKYFGFSSAQYISFVMILISLYSFWKLKFSKPVS